jgi:hypothetical protein
MAVTVLEARPSRVPGCWLRSVRRRFEVVEAVMADEA